MAAAKRVLVTGAAGQIGYALLPQICRGALLGAGAGAQRGRGCAASARTRSVHAAQRCVCA